jgi:nucleoside 2-deoxyribosyltransferase/SAM-dependent methyltransferase
MFSMADQAFNIQCATLLRDQGHEVFLPQEASLNTPDKERSPEAVRVFRLDSREIAATDVLVACIDQESIDSGVACEIGLAYARGIPIIGLYTDIRQYRRGRGLMYKNLYVLGAIESMGRIVSRPEDLIPCLRDLQDLRSRPLEPVEAAPTIVSTHFNAVSERLEGFVSRLESWYNPSWTIATHLDQLPPLASDARILDVGCGTGRITDSLRQKFPQGTYLGYDISSHMVERARARCHDESAQFTSSWETVAATARERPFDLSVLAFVLHDAHSRSALLASVRDCLSPDGIILIVDLAKDDLPVITCFLRDWTVSPLLAHDPRLDAPALLEVAQQTAMAIVDVRISLRTVTFARPGDLDEYLNLFGIYSGMDLPIAFGKLPHDEARELIMNGLATLSYPLADSRAFVTCVLRRDES